MSKYDPREDEPDHLPIPGREREESQLEDGLEDVPERLAERARKPGPLAYMTKNSVAANLIMVVLIVGGIMVIPSIKQEVFPEFTQDFVDIRVPYPGSTPKQVEDSVIRAIEEEVAGLDGVKEVTATASEGVGTVNVEMLLGADQKTVLQDVQAAVDRITSFPADVERPVVSLRSNRQQAISLIVYGEQDEKVLKQFGEDLRDELLQSDEITLVELAGVRPPEISIEVPQRNLRQYGLSLPAIANAVREGAVDVPGGGVKTPGGEILVRTNERKDEGDEFRDLAVLSDKDGSKVELSRIATIIDGFKDNDVAAFFNGKRAVKLDVYRVGDQTPVTVANTVKDFVAEKKYDLPEGVKVAVWNDQSEIYQDRIDLLLRNGYLGLLLVLVVLGLFLNIRLAFWVTLGIPIAFLGAILFMPVTGVSLNMISLFAFLLTLGIVVDDAIIVGEAVYKHREEGMPPLAAAIAGVREVAVPVIFSVVTTMVAFTPLLLVPGTTGKIFAVIPAIVIVVLFMSLIESLLVLPAHLSHGSDRRRGVIFWIGQQQQKFADLLQKGIKVLYVPFLRWTLWGRYLTIAVAIAILLGTLGYVRAGFVGFTFLPKVEGDRVTASVRMPFGTPVEVTEGVQARLVSTAQETFEEIGSEDEHSRGIYSQVGQRTVGGGPGGSSTFSGSHLTQVSLYLVPAGERDWTSAEFSAMWREKMGEVVGAENVSFTFNIGPSAGSPIDIELSHPDEDVLEAAAQELADTLGTYDGVIDIDSGVSLGKEQLELTLTEEGRAMGINEQNLARQVQAAFFGAEAVRQQRGRDELRVYVRRPEAERDSEANIEDMMVMTPQGGETPLVRAANIERGRAYTSIERKKQRRIINVTADVDEQTTTANKVLEPVRSEVLPALKEKYKGLSWSFGGEQQEQAETFGALGSLYLIALLVMFGLMAIAFKSYVQPIIIMLAIPFGIIGAIGGHIIMGFGLSIISILGMVALSGVVVNDSLVLIAAVNNYRREGMSAAQAIVEGAARRFRPILLTTLTTFFGLMPMILETSVQARFLIPMAISLGFGVLFTTFVILILVPSVYLVIEDIRFGFQKVRRFLWPPDTNPEEAKAHG